MKTRLGFTRILTAIALCGVVLISGCTSTGQGVTNGSTEVTQRPYTNVKIRQRGRVRHGEVFAQAAARNALDALTKAGVPEAALISAEIYGIEGLGRFSGGGPPQYYDVWVRVAECPSRVHFKAQASGNIFEMNDKADCVAKAKPADRPAN